MAGAETELVLSFTINAMFDVNGVASGEAQVGPNRRWKITLLNTRTTSTTQTQVTVYRNTIGGQQLDFSRTGNGDTSNTDIPLAQGEKLAVEWTGGASGTIASLDVEGIEYLRGQRAY